MLASPRTSRSRCPTGWSQWWLPISDEAATAASRHPATLSCSERSVSWRRSRRKGVDERRLKVSRFELSTIDGFALANLLFFLANLLFFTDDCDGAPLEMEDPSP